MSNKRAHLSTDIQRNGSIIGPAPTKIGSLLQHFHWYFYDLFAGRQAENDIKFRVRRGSGKETMNIPVRLYSPDERDQETTDLTEFLTDLANRSGTRLDQAFFKSHFKAMHMWNA